MRLLAPVLLLFAFSGCTPKPSEEGQLNTQTVLLPGGQKIRAEVLTDPQDMARGMMFRDSLPLDRGMLFVHQAPGQYSYWMFNCLIPLDIVWMDSGRRIVEIAADTPPCRKEARECPSYGGHAEAQYVLELAGGAARRYGLKIGQALSF